MMSSVLAWSLWSAVLSGVVSWSTAKATLRFNREKLQREFQLEFAMDSAVKALLNDGEYKMRSLAKIKHHLPGFADDDDLRRHLIRAGAICFTSKADAEMWGLLEHHKGQAFK